VVPISREADFRVPLLAEADIAVVPFETSEELRKKSQRKNTVGEDITA